MSHLFLRKELKYFQKVLFFSIYLLIIFFKKKLFVFIEDLFLNSLIFFRAAFLVKNKIREWSILKKELTTKDLFDLSSSELSLIQKLNKILKMSCKGFT